eukprot:TRINITY_DN1258_c0_g1_i1.p1 TRINITY_DN1258_c0_g1~~TRINITY_DN1258_c0_g1_i1.p1  ORF type:complete len:335 (+),score=34.72 TRINITY_DN1258_c0_g1_i1:280-1284(+)
MFKDTSCELSRDFHRFVSNLKSPCHIYNSVPPLLPKNILPSELYPIPSTAASALLDLQSSPQHISALCQTSHDQTTAALLQNIVLPTQTFPMLRDAYDLRRSSSEEFSPQQTPNDSSSEEPRQFTCQWADCTASFSTRTGLATHCANHLTESIPQPGKRRRSDSSQMILCRWNECREELGSIKCLQKHLSQDSHIGQTPYLPRDQFEQKKATLDERRVFPCAFPGCTKRFTDSSNRKKHEKTHDANRERFHCNEKGCPKSYSTKTDLMIHLKVHKQDFPHKCSHQNCDKAFVRVSELYAHERSHDNILPHVCDVCGKKFREKIRLRRHQELHVI